MKTLNPDLIFDQGSDFIFTLTLTDGSGAAINLTGFAINAPIVDVLGRVWGYFAPTITDQTQTPGKCEFKSIAVDPGEDVLAGFYWLDLPANCHTAIRLTPPSLGPVYPDTPRVIYVRRTPQALVKLYELANPPTNP